MKALDAAVFVSGEWSKSLIDFDSSQKCLDQHSDWDFGMEYHFSMVLFFNDWTLSHWVLNRQLYFGQSRN